MIKQEDTRLFTKEELREQSKKDSKIKLRAQLRKFKGDHVYVWYSKDSSGEWRLDHTYPKDLESELGQAHIEDTEVAYAGRKFKQFAYFGPYKDRQFDDATMLIKKYSLTPKREKERKNRELCIREMRKRGVYEEEKSNLEFTEMNPPPRFPQKQ